MYIHYICIYITYVYTLHMYIYIYITHTYIYIHTVYMCLSVMYSSPHERSFAMTVMDHWGPRTGDKQVFDIYWHTDILVEQPRKRTHKEQNHVEIYGIYMGYIWDIYGIYMGYIWDIYGTYSFTSLFYLFFLSHKQPPQGPGHGR